MSPCISQLPAGRRQTKLSADGSPLVPWVNKPVSEHGAPSAGSMRNPHSRLGRKASPHLQGRVMEQSPASPSFVGIDVSKDRLDVHVLPSGQVFAVARSGAGVDELVVRI